MKVYLVVSGEYEDEQLHGVFASLEDAERAEFLLGVDEGDIQEWEVESIPPLPKLEGKHPFKVSIHIPHEEYPIYVEKGWEDCVSSLSSVEETYTFSQDDQRYDFYIFASDKEDAKKIALTKFLNIGS